MSSLSDSPDDALQLINTMQRHSTSLVSRVERLERAVIQLSSRLEELEKQTAPPDFVLSSQLTNEYCAYHPELSQVTKLILVNQIPYPFEFNEETRTYIKKHQRDHNYRCGFRFMGSRESFTIQLSGLDNLSEIFITDCETTRYGNETIFRLLYLIDNVKQNKISKIIFSNDTSSYFHLMNTGFCGKENGNRHPPHNTLLELFSCERYIGRDAEKTKICMDFWKANIDKVHYCNKRIPPNTFPRSEDLVKYTDCDFYLPLL